MDLSRTFNCIRYTVLQDKLTEPDVDAYLISWITFHSLSVCIIGTPQGTALSPVLFTPHTSDFNPVVVGYLNTAKEEIGLRYLVQKDLRNISRTKEDHR